MRRGPDLRMHSRETRSRAGPKRVVIRYEFRFSQEDRLVYFGDQSAMFVKGLGLDASRDRAGPSGEREEVR